MRSMNFLCLVGVSEFALTEQDRKTGGTDYFVMHIHLYSM